MSGARRSAVLASLVCLAVPLLPGCGPRPDPDTLVLSGLGAASYGEEAGPAAALSLSVEARLKSIMPAPPSPDACLDRAASELAGRLGEDCALWPGWIEGPVLQHSGCPDLNVDAVVVCSAGRDPAGFLERVASEAPKVPLDRFGAGRRSQGLLRSAWVFVSVTRGLSLDLVPRTVEPGRRLRLGWRLGPGIEHPRVYSMSPGGVVTAESVLRDSDPGTFLSFPVLSGPGRHWVEIMASGKDGPAILALFPVEAGARAPTSFTRPSRPEFKASSEEEAEAGLLALLNEERRLRGLPPLESDHELGTVARAWSAELRRLGKVVHLSADGEGPGHRAEAAGYSSLAIGEVLASGGSVREAHEALMASPAHRAGMLDPRFTRAGIGASLARPGEPGPTLYAAEELAMPLRKLSPSQAAAGVLERAAELRKSFSLPEAAASASLSAAAESVLAEWSEAGPADFLASRLGPALRKAGHQGSCDAVLQVVSEASEFVLPASINDAKVKAVGAAARSADAGNGTVVLLLVAAE
ncbi:MAG: CAP domain-containing protein [Elusimicrobia bacterium]|nr:CAP domain-containing protein [Elusimicrobiota bacterium]